MNTKVVTILHQVKGHYAI